MDRNILGPITIMRHLTKFMRTQKETNSGCANFPMLPAIEGYEWPLTITGTILNATSGPGGSNGLPLTSTCLTTKVFAHMRSKIGTISSTIHPHPTKLFSNKDHWKCPMKAWHG